MRVSDDRCDLTSYFGCPIRGVLSISNSRILVVDDEELVAEVTTLHLEALGHSVVCCTDSGVALAEFKQDSSGFDALVTDYAMAGMSGLDLAEAVWKLRSSLPIVFMTGYGEDLAFKIMGLPGPTTVLHKPFRRDDLKASLETVLQKSVDRRPE